MYTGPSRFDRRAKARDRMISARRKLLDANVDKASPCQWCNAFYTGVQVTLSTPTCRKCLHIAKAALSLVLEAAGDGQGPATAP